MTATQLSLTTQPEIFDIFDRESTDRLLEIATDEEELAMYIYWHVHYFYESAPDDEIVPSDEQLEDIRHILIDFIWKERILGITKHGGDCKAVYACEFFVELEYKEYVLHINPSNYANTLYLSDIHKKGEA